MNKMAIALHGGASESSDFLRTHQKEIEQVLAQAVDASYDLLSQQVSALDVVEAAVKMLEDSPYLNAGRGSALNARGEVEMDASIMEGSTLKAGAVSMVRAVKNPIRLARVVMEKTRHVFLSGYGALELAQDYELDLEPESYFITPHQLAEFQRLQRIETTADKRNKKMMGTVGAVALDCYGNIAAGTSTGGISNCLPGRIGDSCVIGAGCYANNSSCAVSGTGEGEYLIRGVVANSIALMTEHGLTLQEACDFVVQKRIEPLGGEVGVIALNPKGDFGFSFNTEIMKRAWKSSSQALMVRIDR